MSERKREAVDFEDYAYAYIRRRFPARLGWKIEQERTLKDSTRVDYCLWRTKFGKKERAVVEIKNVDTLTCANIDQIDHYARQYHASYRLICVPLKTLIDDSVGEYANDLVIEIVRLRY
jgi:hypothetical protein